MAFFAFQLKPLKASSEVDSEFTVIRDDRVHSQTPTWGCIPEKMAFMWVQMSVSAKNSVK